MSIFCSSVILLRIASTRSSTPSGAGVAEGTSAAVIAIKNKAKITAILRCASVVSVRAGIIGSLLRLLRAIIYFGEASLWPRVALQFVEFFHFAVCVRRFPLLAINAGQTKMRLGGQVGIFFLAQKMYPGLLSQVLVSIHRCSFTQHVKRFRHVLFQLIGMCERLACFVEFP